MVTAGGGGEGGREPLYIMSFIKLVDKAAVLFVTADACFGSGGL